jgi:hypothetical protein
VTRLALLLLPLAAACGSGPAPEANQAAPPPERPAPETEVAAAERLVRSRLGATAGDARFSDPVRSASDGVSIICGRYEQGGRRHRYIVVNREDAFIEPQMRAGEMDRAVAEFCREGSDNGPRTRTPEAGEKG